MPPRTNTYDNYTVIALKHLIFNSNYEDNPQAKSMKPCDENTVFPSHPITVLEDNQ